MSAKNPRVRHQVLEFSEGEAIDYAAADQDITSTPSRAVYIGTGGNLKVDLLDGGTVTFNGLLVGTVYRIAVTKIYKTGSTAAGLILR